MTFAIVQEQSTCNCIHKLWTLCKGEKGTNNWAEDNTDVNGIETCVEEDILFIALGDF